MKATPVCPSAFILGVSAVLMSSTLATAGPIMLQKKPAFAPKPEGTYQLAQDLEVTAIEMTPKHPVAGQSVAFAFTVKNTGNIKTPKTDMVVTFWDTNGGSDWGFAIAPPSVPSLDAGKTHVSKSSVTFITLGDSVGVAAKVDHSNKIKETNESNNEKREFFGVQCKPDIATGDYRKPTPPLSMVSTYPNQTLKYSISVYNNGWCNSKPGQVSVGCDDLWPVSVPLPVVPGRSKIALPVSLQWLTAGVRTCRIKLDSTNTNKESIETNNGAEFKVSVISLDWPKP